MSIIFPHAPYAEDQPLAHTILTTHVLHRGFQSGAFVAPFITALSVYRSRNADPTTTTISKRAIFGSRPLALANASLPATFVRISGVSAVYGTAFLTVGLVARMWGREDIEWRDRAWRLLENQGQRECDVFSLVGTELGVGTLAVAKWTGRVSGPAWSGWRAWVGAAAVGNLVGVGEYMGWRYGWKGGWKEEGGKV